MPWPGALNAPARGGSAQRSASGFCCLPKQESMTELSRGTRARPNHASRYESAARSHESVFASVLHTLTAFAGAAFFGSYIAP